MGTILATIAVFGLAILALGLGVLLSGKPLPGTCGRGGGEDCAHDLSCEACPNRGGRRH